MFNIHHAHNQANQQQNLIYKVHSVEILLERRYIYVTTWMDCQVEVGEPSKSIHTPSHELINLGKRFVEIKKSGYHSQDTTQKLLGDTDNQHLVKPWEVSIVVCHPAKHHHTQQRSIRISETRPRSWIGGTEYIYQLRTKDIIERDSVDVL